MKSYKIFQLDKNVCKDYAKKVYAPLEFVGTPVLSDYKVVYEGSIDGDDDAKVCEALFVKFNMNHPTDYKGRSLSVSDIVMLDGKAYYCDSFGFKALESTL